MSLLPTTASATAGTDAKAPLGRLARTIDSVYFLMYDGWEQELESNRWHYARRWARHFPVTLLQPRQRFGSIEDAVPTATIENCEILPILEPGPTPSVLRGLVQAGQLLEQMRKRGHSRPLLWCYNPLLAGLYAAVPAAARVYHASENYFDFAGMSDDFYREVETALRISDLVVPVSSGVADGIRARVPEAHVEVVTNGCDTSHYGATGSADPRIAAARDDFEHIAIFAGNINSRLDFELLDRAAASNPATLIVIVGPVGNLDARDTTAWRTLCRRHNVQHLGATGAAELAGLYRAADLGFIPYRREPWLVRNGFPLKTLEMAATGLPVAASRMEPIAGLAEAIVVADDDDGFLAAFSSLSRSTLTDEERRELVELAAANDYDRKFEQVVSHVAEVIPDERGVHTRLDDLLVGAGNATWRESCLRIVDRAKPTLLWRAVLLAHEGVSRLVPTGTRERLIPSTLRSWVRNRVA